jgi:predicted ATPase/signal transduction histidine kinase/ActR/RegA family two-component response regulator
MDGHYVNNYYIDDLQWCDSASLKVIQTIVNDESKLLFICSYRDSEVSESHPAIVSLSEMKDNSIPYQDITLLPLSIAHIVQWVVDILQTDDERYAEPLAHYIWKRCDGNPFYVKMLLQSLYNSRLIYYNTNRWEYNLENANFPASENVVEFMIRQMANFSETTRRLLQIFACLGNKFSLFKLQLVTEKSLEELIAELVQAIDNGLLIIIGDKMYFGHDKIQEAAYSQLSISDQIQIHIHIGKKLLDYYLKSRSENYLLDTVNHLNYGKEVFLSNQESSSTKLSLAQLNLAAGQKSLNTGAYTVATTYLKNGVDLFHSIDESPWDSNHELGFALYNSIMDADYSEGLNDETEQVFNLLLSKAKSNLEKGQVYKKRIMQLTNSTKFPQALEIGRTALKLFNIDVPVQRDELEQAMKTEQENVQKFIASNIQSIDRDTLNEFVNSLPTLTDSQDILVLSLLQNIIAPCLLSDPFMFRLITTKAMNLSLTRGVYSDIPTIFIHFAMMLLYTSEQVPILDVKYSYAFGTSAVELCDKIAPNNLAQKSIVYHIFGCHILPWFEHMKNCDYYVNMSIQYGIDSGNLQFATFSRYLILIMFYRGDCIDHILEEINKSTDLLSKVNNQLALKTYRTLQLQLFHLLGRRHPVKSEVLENTFNSFIEEIGQNNDYLLCHSFLFKSIRLYIEDTDLEQAYQLSCDVDRCLKSLPSFITTKIHHFYQSLIIFRILFDQQNHENITEMKQRLAIIGDELSVLSNQCPYNFAHRYLLFRAEEARLNQDYNAACDLYDEAIHAAQVKGYLHEAAIAFECAAKFWLFKGKPHIAKIYLKQSYRSYRDWGATNKLELLYKKYPNLISTNNLKNVSPVLTSVSSNTANVSLALLDLDVVVRSSQLISSTIDMKKLLRVLMNLIVETAGAQTGALIIDGHIEATYDQSLTEQIDTMCAIPVDTYPNACQAIIEYVMRTKEMVCMGNAAMSSQFGTNGYIMRNRTKSVLCMPVKQENELRAVLYVENNLTSDAFPEARVQLLSLLTSQMAIALENAKFFQVQIRAAEEIVSIQRKRAKEAEKFRKKQEDFIDRICHELRNPIHAQLNTVDYIASLISQLEKTIPQSEDITTILQNIHHGLTAIESCANHQKTITDDVLTLSKLEDQSVELHMQEFSIQKLISSVCDMFEATIHSKHLKLTCLHNNNFDRLIGDPDRISQILINILSNAIKFTLENGEIQISYSVTETDDSKAKLEISVHDNGIGISDTSALFNRFKQSYRHHSEYNNGSGLGLFISKNLCQLMGGEIFADSKPGDTTFTFTVQCTIQEPSIPSESNNNSTQTDTSVTDKDKNKPLTILIAEDNSINQKVLMRLLQAQNCICHVANNGVEAVDLYKQLYKTIDVILMDIEMPVLDGHGATKAIRSLEQEMNIHPVCIVAVSGNARDAHAKQAIQSGMNGYLTKPIRSTQLHEAIHTLLNNEKAR